MNSESNKIINNFEILNNKLYQPDKELHCYKTRKEFMKCYLQKDIEYCKKKYNNLIKKCIPYYD